MTDLILLHGAIGTQHALDPLATLLADRFAIHRLHFSGHGGQPFAEDFSISRFADELLAWKKGLPVPGDKPPAVFGYSMGGYVAAAAELRQPGSFSHIVTLGTKWLWTPESAARETAMLDPDMLIAKVPAFAAQLEARHQPND